MKKAAWLSVIFPAVLLASCHMKNQSSESNNTSDLKKGSFGYDLNFLKGKDSVLVLKDSSGNAQIIISPKYQGKVFTSTAEGESGKSYGWINYSAFKDSLDTHMNAYGGENRLWIGPEGGKYSVFFKPGTKMEFENWHTPPAVDTESWDLNKSSDRAVSLSKNMQLQNYVGTNLQFRIDRDIEIMEKKDIAAALNITLNDSVKTVGFKTANTLINTGNIAWTQQTGAPCIWMLDMFTPSQKATIVVPYNPNATVKVATTNYFGEIPTDRINYHDNAIFYKADGKMRGKLGVPPQRAKNMAGSYDEQNNVLTVLLFDVDNNGTYLNQEWTPDKNPLIGDAVNAYNDGPLADGKQMGPFYEIESVSPAAFLKPGDKLVHHHSVFHFTGDKAALDAIAQKTLGVSLNQITTTFK